VLEGCGGPDQGIRAVEERDERAVGTADVTRLEAALAEERGGLLCDLRAVARE